MTGKESTMSITEIMKQAQTLSPQERKELVKLLVDTLDVSGESKPRRLSELRGLGKEIWQGIDPQDYVTRLRSEWDERP
jgi:hypothetical protein